MHEANALVKDTSTLPSGYYEQWGRLHFQRPRSEQESQREECDSLALEWR